MSAFLLYGLIGSEPQRRELPALSINPTTLTPMPDDQQQRLAEAVRTACVEAALETYEDAGIRGLCHEGRWEVAIQAIRHLDLGAVLQKATADAAESEKR